MEPIIASTLRAEVSPEQMPAGYKTGIHMFGSDSAFNLNSAQYIWNGSAASVYIYYKNASEVTSSAGSNFSVGVLGISGIGGFCIGAFATAFGMKAYKKKKEENTAE